MVAAINRTNFTGRQVVTCWTCHHGRITPSTTVGLDAWYDAPHPENDALILQAEGLPAADQILAKYLHAPRVPPVPFPHLTLPTPFLSYIPSLPLPLSSTEFILEAKSKDSGHAFSKRGLNLTGKIAF